ncbi:MAG: hypothetical protein AAF653_20365, partial [Chloroflexota bacterium]
MKFTIIVLSLVGASIVLFPVALVSISIYQIRTKSLDDVQDYIGVAIPESASSVEFEFSAIRDVEIIMRFDAPDNDMNAFLRSIEAHCVEHADESYRAPINYSDDRSWWIEPEQDGQADHVCFDDQ